MAKLLVLEGAPQSFTNAKVALSGDIAVVGSAVAGVGGVAYVFERDRGGPNRWGQVARLEPAGVAANDSFGSSVAIAGDTIAVGAANRATGQGAAYIFERNFGGPDNWGEVRELVASSATPFASLGTSVAISGNTVAVGAPDEGNSYVGSVWVFERDLGGPDNWGEAATLIQSDGNIGIGYFGGRVTIEGDTIAAGAHGAYHQGLETGAAYVFDRNAGGPGNWGEVQKLTASDFAEPDWFGDDLVLSGNTLAISSFGAGGSVYIFERGGTWTEFLKLPTLGIGWAVALDGDTLLARRTTTPGAVMVFGRDVGGQGNWGVKGEHVASDGYPTNWFGKNLAVVGDTYVIGAQGDDHGAHASACAYVFAPTPLVCPETYCTPGTTSSGCNPTLSTRGLPSVTAAEGFELVARGVEGRQFGLFFYGVSGRSATPWGDPMNGCTSTLCVAAPLFRCAVMAGNGTLGQCDGTYTYDLAAQWASIPSQTPSIGLTVQAQLWLRDANNACTGFAPYATTSLSDAIEFVVGP